MIHLAILLFSLWLIGVSLYIAGCGALFGAVVVGEKLLPKTPPPVRDTSLMGAALTSFGDALTGNNEMCELCSLNVTGWRGNVCDECSRDWQY